MGKGSYSGHVAKMAGKKPLSKSERSVETCDSGGLAKSKTMYISDKRLVPRMKEVRFRSSNWFIFCCLGYI